MISDKESSTYRTSFDLNKIEIYVTRFQFSFQRFDIHLKYIIIDAMLEMLSWKLITTTSSYCIVQKLIEEALETESYFMKVSSDSDLQNIKTELDEIEIRRIWRQILYFTLVWDNEFLNMSITVYADVIHDDHTSWSRKETA